MILTHLGNILSAIGGAVLGGIIAYNIGYASGYNSGSNAEKTAALNRTAIVIQERIQTNETLNNADRTALCAALGGVLQPDGSTCQ